MMCEVGAIKKRRARTSSLDALSIIACQYPFIEMLSYT